MKDIILKFVFLTIGISVALSQIFILLFAIYYSIGLDSLYQKISIILYSICFFPAIIYYLIMSLKLYKKLTEDDLKEKKE